MKHAQLPGNGGVASRKTANRTDQVVYHTWLKWTTCRHTLRNIFENFNIFEHILTPWVLKCVQRCLSVSKEYICVDVINKCCLIRIKIYQIYIIFLECSALSPLEALNTAKLASRYVFSEIQIWGNLSISGYSTRIDLRDNGWYR